MALTSSGSRKIPLELMTNPRNFPVATPRKDLVGFIFQLILAHDVEHFFQISEMVDVETALDGIVVYIALDRLAYVRIKDFVHRPMICSSCILQIERHDCVAVHPKWHSE